MSVPASFPGGVFVDGALPPHVLEAVWRGTEVSDSRCRTVSSGFAALDAQLPGAGWPTHSLTELLLPQAALCEWRLLAPAVTGFLEGGGRIYLVAPPKEPCAAGLVQLGVEPTQLTWIEASTPVDRLWVTEQIVKSDPAGAVLAWLPQARPEQVRRLQVHAAACDAPIFLFRPAASLRDSSPSPLRVAVAPAPGWDLEIRIPKRKGSSLDEAIYVNAMPSNLKSVVPPRLKGSRAASRSVSEAADARTLGRIPAPTLASVPLPH
ncbi:MAG TPA: translesion DNA synthesis-associated protein ImuA [Acidovorax sp.]|nr:translesion DNA synthesis-associated protein ImuA [Acidovorax sp.]